jgi:hypothetical protein
MADIGLNTDPVKSALRMSATPYTAPGPHVGALNSHVAGRTDHLPIDVKAESFVIPADVVSGLGEGNTSNGMRVLDQMFQPAAGSQAVERKDGGRVPIMAAGGEYVVPPEVVSQIGGGDMKRGHQILEHFVKSVRKDTIKTLQKLPRPHR